MCWDLYWLKFTNSRLHNLAKFKYKIKTTGSFYKALGYQEVTLKVPMKKKFIAAHLKGFPK